MTSESEYDLIDKSHEKIMAAIESFVLKPFVNTPGSEIISSGLEIFLEMKSIKSASLFYSTDEDFSFEHRTTIPPDLTDTIKSRYEKLLEYWVIGSAIEQAFPYYYRDPDDSDFTTDTIIIPLIIPSGIKGIILLSADKKYYLTNSQALRHFAIAAALLAHSLELKHSAIKLNRIEEMINQAVGSRTNDLELKYRELSSIVESLPCGVIISDFDEEQVLDMNTYASEKLGADKSKFIYTNPNSLFEKYHSFTAEISDQNQQISFHDRLRKSARDFVSVDRQAFLVRLPNKILRIDAFYDITYLKKIESNYRQNYEQLEQKVQERTNDLLITVNKLKKEVKEKQNAQEEINQLYQKEKELSKLKSRFVSMISHEFKTPLTSIKSSAQLIKKFKTRISDDELMNYLDRIISVTDHMTELVENTLFIGKESISKDEIIPVMIDIEEFCKNQVKEVNYRMGTNKEFKLFIKQSSYNFVSDQRMLKLIISNLLSNSVKYSPEHSPVEIYAEFDRNYAVFTIKDYGIGISEEEQKSIFNIFYRGTNSENIPGTGIGLATVMHSLKLLGGEIQLNSKLNSGTTFRVSIPNLGQI